MSGKIFFLLNLLLFQGNNFVFFMNQWTQNGCISVNAMGKQLILVTLTFIKRMFYWLVRKDTRTFLTLWQRVWKAKADKGAHLISYTLLCEQMGTSINLVTLNFQPKSKSTLQRHVPNYSDKWSNGPFCHTKFPDRVLMDLQLAFSKSYKSYGV